MVGLDIAIETIANTVKDISIGQKGYPIIVDSMGTVLAHPFTDYLGKSIDQSILMSGIGKGTTSLDFQVEENQALFNKYASYTPIERTGWYVITTYYYDEVDDIVVQIMTFILSISFLAMVVASIIIWIFAKKLSKI